jgi:membrane-bound serine protease (ClpP class)
MGTPADPSEKVATALAPVDVLEVSGLLDPILVREIEAAIDRSVADGSQALILQMNTPGATVSRGEMAALAQRIATAEVPVAIWVGPSGARAFGLPAQLLAAAEVTGMAPGTRIGKMGTPLTVPGVEIEFGEATEQLRSGTLGFQDARRLGALNLDTTDEGVPVLRNMVLALDGVQVDRLDVELDTVEERLADDGTVERTATTVRFFKLGLVPRLFHTVGSPAVTYLLITIGLALLIFEFFTAGIGIAGMVGAACTVLGCYGLVALPTRGWAVVLLFLAMAAFAIDVQVGLPRLWTGVGLVLYSVSSWFLFERIDGVVLRPSWITLITGVVGVALTFIVGMPSMVRTRFATPTVGREWMIGEMGVAAEAINPEGVVQVREGRWRARTNRATPVARGEAVRVVAIDGITLEVEPEEGGARDYRERRAR